MKKKLILIALACLFVVMLAITASAEEAITVTYNWYSGGVWETAAPNEDGSYTLRSEKKSGNGSVTLTDGSVVSKEFYGWFDEEGNQYAPGATVTFTKSTRLYEAYGITVYNAEDLHKMNGWQDSTYVKLGADITTDKAFGNNWCTRVIDMNGHNITSTTNGSAISVARGAIILLGEGKFTHAPATVSTSVDTGFIWFNAHGYGDQDHPQLCWIGKDVEIETPYNMLYVNSVAREKHPNIVVSGKVSARSVARLNPAVIEAKCYISSSAVINVTANLLEFKDTTGTSKYMTLTLDGTVNVANGTSPIFTDFVLGMVDVEVNGGKFCVTSTDIENINYYLPDTLMLKETTEGELTWQEIVPSDCKHNWTKNEDLSVDPTTATFGKDVFDCTECERQKTVVTVYNPSNAEITITVKDEKGALKDVTVNAGDVLDISITGVGENTNYTLVGIKGTEEYPLESIVSVSIPFGVGVIAITSTNEVLETINVMDGADVAFSKLNGLMALKTINIGVANVTFASVGTNTTLESIKSDVPGANVMFLKSCLDGKSNFKYLTMSNGSAYSFGENSFRKTGIETLIFPDEASISFAGNAAFYEAKVKYAYFGKSITKIYNKPLDCANNLEVAVIMSATSVTEYCFCVAGANNATSVLKVYCHSDDISINNNTFINRQNHGVEFYTIDPDIKSLSNCKYTVYNGIPHAYAEGIVKEPTCIETGIAGSATDCVCGVNEVVTYTVYTAEGSEEKSTEQRELPMVDIHVLGTDLANIKYKNGYLTMGTKEYYCALCHAATVEEDNPSANAIFENLGYSVCTYGDYSSIIQGYGVDKLALEAYKAFCPSFTYGIVAVGNSSAEAISPLKIENGTVVKNISYAIFSPINAAAYDCFDIKLKCGTEDAKDVNVVFCAYVYDGARIKYIDNGETSGTVVGNTFNIIANAFAQ